MELSRSFYVCITGYLTLCWFFKKKNWKRGGNCVYRSSKFFWAYWEDGEHSTHAMCPAVDRWAQNGKFLSRASLSNDHINCFFHSLLLLTLFFSSSFVRVFATLSSPISRRVCVHARARGVCDNVVKMFHIKYELEKIQWKSIFSLLLFFCEVRGKRWEQFRVVLRGNLMYGNSIHYENVVTWNTTFKVEILREEFPFFISPKTTICSL